MPIPAFVTDDLEKLGLELPEVLLEQLAAYLHDLLASNKRFNLTGIREPEAAWRKHIIDCTTILPGLDDLEEGRRVVDIGSGGGLPGMVIAITRPDLSMTLVESTGKKATFLRECADRLGLGNVDVRNDRAEILGKDAAFREQFDVAVCRAVGPMRELLEYTLPFVKVGGRVLAMKGPSVVEELRDSGDALEVLGGCDVDVVDAYPDGFDIHTVIVVVTKTRATPAAYPRLPGVPRQSPL